MCYYNKKNPSPIVAAKRKELNPRKKIDDFIDEKIDECPLHKQTIFDFSSAQSEHTSHSYKQLYKHWTIRNVDNAKVTYRIELSFSDNHENIHTIESGNRGDSATKRSVEKFHGNRTVWTSIHEYVNLNW